MLRYTTVCCPRWDSCIRHRICIHHRHHRHYLRYQKEDDRPSIGRLLRLLNVNVNVIGGEIFMLVPRPRTDETGIAKKHQKETEWIVDDIGALDEVFLRFFIFLVLDLSFQPVYNLFFVLLFMLSLNFF